VHGFREQQIGHGIMRGQRHQRHDCVRRIRLPKSASGSSQWLAPSFGEFVGLDHAA
jgi:hypothetical protein